MGEGKKSCTDAEETGFKAVVLTVKMGEMKEEGCIIAGAGGRTGRPLGCLTSILSLYINLLRRTALMRRVIYRSSITRGQVLRPRF